MVEQGTENPRVGGSTPSLATISLLTILVFATAAGCAADECERLCDRTGNRLATCLDEWPATWDDLDAESRAGFQQSCRQDWEGERTDLEPRELEDALDQCDEALTLLSEARQDGTVCDLLRALYLEG